MAATDVIESLWLESFPNVSRGWLAMMKRHCDIGSNAMLTTDAHGEAVSSLLLERRAMTYHDTEQPVSYLSFACTRPKFRGLGSMKHLLADALVKARNRGDVAVTLIPANHYLQLYYEHNGGWAQTMYNRVECYTSPHRFHTDGFTELKNADTEQLYEAYSQFERTQGGCVILHDRSLFDFVAEDTRMSHGCIVAAADDAGIAAIAIAVPHPADEKAVVINSLLGRDKKSCDAAAGFVMQRFPGWRLEIIRPACATNPTVSRRLVPGGMMRIINPQPLLDTLSRSMPKKWRKLIRITDSIIPENNHTYIAIGGKGCIVADDDALRQELQPFDCWDIDISVLARLLFGSPLAGHNLDIPAVRPVMSLMPD